MAKRILSLAPSNTEILFALGAGDRVVGVTSFCDFPPAARALPRVGSWISVTNIKQFDELKPDLILTSMFVPNLFKNGQRKKRLSSLISILKQLREYLNLKLKLLQKDMRQQLQCLKRPEDILLLWV